MTRAVPAWLVAGTSVAGPRHAETGAACQDSHSLDVTAGGMLIAVASDGAGSARFGGDGAAILCEQVRRALSAQEPDAGETGTPWSERRGFAAAARAVVAAVEAAREEVAALARARGVGMAAFHATLVGAAVWPGEGGIFFHIGDGAALATDGRGAWHLSPPANGEYADTTYFFTQPDWRAHLRLSRIAMGFDTIFVMTDGVTDIALCHRDGRPEPFMPFFDPIARYLAANSREDGERALSATLDSGAVRARTGDDKTLLWAQVSAS